MPEEPSPTVKDSKAAAVSSLLSSSDPLVKLVTLGLVVFTGLGNFWATNKAENRNSEEVDRALSEIHYIRARIDYFENRQVELLDKVREIDTKVQKIPTP